MTEIQRSFNWREIEILINALPKFMSKKILDNDLWRYKISISGSPWTIHFSLQWNISPTQKICTVIRNLLNQENEGLITSFASIYRSSFYMQHKKVRWTFPWFIFSSQALSIFGQYSQETKIRWLNIIVSLLVCYITIKDLFMTSLILVQSGTWKGTFFKPYENMDAADVTFNHASW